jgi:hypothetical protein
MDALTELIERSTRQQGATVERAVVVTGGAQTSRESAYVQASRAREGTEWFLSREELGLRRARRATRRAARQQDTQQPRAHTVARAPRAAHPEWGPGFERTIAPSRLRLLSLARAIEQTRAHGLAGR